MAKVKAKTRRKNRPDTAILKLIVGLGNPGPPTPATATMPVSGSCAGSVDVRRELRAQSKFHGEAGAINIAGTGNSVAVAVDLHESQRPRGGGDVQLLPDRPEQMLVAYDEIDLEVGTARFKAGGGHGGHNGLRSIIECLGDAMNFGVCDSVSVTPDTNPWLPDTYLATRQPRKRKSSNKWIEDAISVLPGAVTGGWEEAMRILHTGNQET